MATRWRVTKTDWKNLARYDRFAKVSERVLRQTSTGDAPWIVLEGADANYRTLTVATKILKSLMERLGATVPKGKAQPHAANVPPPCPRSTECAFSRPWITKARVSARRASRRGSRRCSVA